MFGTEKLPRAIHLLSLPLATAATLPAIAQETKTQRGLEEVVVTAQKREQNLQDVPVAVSAVSGEQLQEAVIKDVFDLQTNTPGLVAGQNQNNTTANFAIRGIGTSGQNFGLESSVGLYVDGVYRSRPSSMINNLVDMEAVEVLRGPQGTLFGKNTAAGAIQFRTRAPGHETDGFVEVTAGNYGLVNTAAAANLSLVPDVLAVRTTVFSSERDGYVDASIDAGTEDINNRDRWGARLQALYTPTDTLSARLILDKSEIDEICCAALAAQDSLVNDAGAPGPSAILQGIGGTIFTGDQFEDYETALNFAPISRADDAGASLEVNWDLSDSWTLTSVTASRDYDSYDIIDSDFGNVDLISTENDSTQSSVSQELRLAFSGERGNAVLGAYYFDQDIALDYEVVDRQHIDDFLPAALGLTGLIDGIDSFAGLTGIASADPFLEDYRVPHRAEQQHQSWALFGQFDYDLSEALTLTMGLRYTEEDKSMLTRFSEWIGDEPWEWSGPTPDTPTASGYLGQMGAAYAAGDMPTLMALAGDPDVQAALAPFAREGWGNWLLAANAPRPDIDADLSDEQVTGTVKLSYALSADSLVYASYGTGYKSGGTNTDRIAAGFEPLFDAENSDAVEVGLKSEFPAQSLRLNLALHHTALDNYQANAFTGDGFNLQNAGDLESYGAEAELFWSPADNTTVTAAYAYTKATFKEFSRGNCWVATPWHTGEPDPGQTDPSVNVCDRTGDPLANTPDHFLTLGLRQDFQLGGGVDGYLHGEYSYKSDAMTSNVNDPLMEQEAYGLLNLRAGLLFAGLDADLTLWGRNVLDERPVRTHFDAVIQTGTVMAYPGEPRTYGLTLNKRF
ncbi:TonB-dependent receptor [Microbulbifer halophilus]|uniref:TonB-dependent receptor domain-containing protein n=1 Tax=Microbulbifer halophilus TaxID=453963 RepID=A0ABW5EK63_9GAMM|nr:TonB-dependent receptor [Microbulbifer halophilus]MCW8127702.1 TonB-dependent receptor [Microbulbifer halophilus]